MEIERKWIISEIPNDLLLSSPLIYERHFLFIGNDIEIRVQKKGNKYEFERKITKSELSREINKFEITEAEYNLFSKNSIASIVRESYQIEEYPEISIKKYGGRHIGLIRVEIEFENENEANLYTPLGWFGKEITEGKLGKDKELIKLSNDEFNKELIKYIK